MAAKRPAHTDLGGPDRPLKKKAKGSPVYDHLEKRTTKSTYASTRSENRGGSGSSFVRSEDRAETYLLHVDSDATDYDTNATISERLWISDAEEEDNDDDDYDNDDDDWKKDQDGRIEEPWHGDDMSASLGTEEAVRSPPTSQGPGSSPAPKLEYDTSISSPDGDLFLKNEWYWDESWDESWDWYDSSHLSQETSCCSAVVEPPALAPTPSLEQQQQLNDDLCQDLPPWYAPPEPFRPLHPYTKGQTLVIWRHEAAPPFYQDLNNNRTSLDDIPLPAGPGDMLSLPQPQQRVPASNRELRATTVVELCLNYPPLAGKTRTEEGPRRLTIVDTIHAKDGEGAQLVICRLDVDAEDDNEGGGGSKEYVAKIYDPLYYGFADPYWKEGSGAMPWDVATEADRAYCAEVAAYTELERLGFGGNEVPRFHGSWTFQLAVDSPAAGARVSREVRMILTEHVRAAGKSMTSVRTDLLPEAEKLAAVGMVMRASARMAGPLAGVGGGDACLVSPRHVVVCGLEERVCSQWSTPSCCAAATRVAFVDLSRATVRRLESDKSNKNNNNNNKPSTNPLLDWWGNLDSVYRQYGKWVPARWQHRPRPMQEWLWEVLYNTTDEFPPLEKTSLRWANEDEKVSCK